MRKRVQHDANAIIRELLIEEEALWWEYQMQLSLYNDREHEQVIPAHLKWHVVYRLVKTLGLEIYIKRFKQ